MSLVEHPWKHCLCVIGAAASTGLLVGAATDSASAWGVGVSLHAALPFAAERSDNQKCIAAGEDHAEIRRQNYQFAEKGQRHV